MTALRVWAPLADRVEVAIAGQRKGMTGTPDGWWTAEITSAESTLNYAFVLDGGEPRPDPRSAWLPLGVHGPSRWLDHAAFAWTDHTWRGVPLAGAVLYELHIGTFTEAGTFDAALEHLEHFVDLGITAVELLPCNAFAGERGWGYDGVGWFTVHEPYGGPAGLKRFVDGCHARGIGVVMDVVHNHLGPAGNYLAEFGPYLTEAHSTPWGSAVNLDQPGSGEVRRFLLDSALMWLRDYHLDGLRLDAVHELRDDSALHLLEELRMEVAVLASQLGKPLWLVAESDRNDPRTVLPPEAGGLGLDGQWNDDLHHALHATLTGETTGYYGDFGSLEALSKALSKVFVHDGSWSSFRGRKHGRSVPTAVPGHRFVAYLQNHDQIGNRAAGDRQAATLPDGLLKVGAALLLTSAYTPMLFMGQEWGTRRPWQFFSDHDGSLGAAVSAGRRREFARLGWSAGDVPDPQDRVAFETSTLDWAELAEPRCEHLLGWYRALLALRRSRPELSDGRWDQVQPSWSEANRWFVMRRGQLAVVCNLSQDRQQIPLAATPAGVLLASEPGFAFGSDHVETDGHSVLIVDLL